MSPLKTSNGLHFTQIMIFYLYKIISYTILCCENVVIPLCILFILFTCIKHSKGQRLLLVEMALVILKNDTLSMLPLGPTYFYVSKYIFNAVSSQSQFCSVY